MANEIITQGPTGTNYGVVLSSSRQYWNNLTAAFEAYNAANWAATKYVIALTQDGSSGIFGASFPSGITTAGSYSVVFRNQAGGSPSPTDSTSGMSGQLIYWSGSAQDFPVSTVEANTGAATFTGTTINATTSGGGGGMTLSTFTFSSNISSTPTTTSDTTITNNSGIYAIDLTAPSNGIMTWSLYVRRATGAAGIFVASNATYSTTDGATYVNGISAAALASYQIITKITGKLYYFVLTNSNATPGAATINCVS